ncbi:hypothetical protein FP2506_18819 [Fulvimarina pelagi HTCC2506]|uniref:Uncharacterized protein n=1 Tax=Fulvimarina pelagi HTCC2506 TaxID=314231 RepID=Q0G0L9_9HYPH|nr:hypothetical protein FP2506_18819 [Fulvimarina pelagi HTCC2506]
MTADDIEIVLDPSLSDDPIFTAEIRTPLGSLDVMARVTIEGRSLALDGTHIGGDPAKTWGPAALRNLAQAVMEKLDVDEIIVVGAVRTTGANPGRTPRLRRLRRAPASQGAPKRGP